MTIDPSPDQLRTVLADAGVELPAPRGKIEAALADRDMVDDPGSAVENAIDSGALVPDSEGTWGTLYDLGGGGERATDGEGGDTDGVDREAAVDALRDVLRYYHARLDETIADHTDGGEHPDRPTTARDYFEQARGWDTDTVDDLLLGWAPPDHVDDLVAYLHERGHSREAMLATGAIGEADSGGLYATFTGRYVLPYFDADGDPAYAIARVTGGEGGGGAGYGGHPSDYKPGKYAKLRHTDDRVPFAEPIYGLDTLDEADHVVVAEGIADAITARQTGYAVLSPVAREFKESHFDPLVAALDTHGVERVTVVGDADNSYRGERPDDEPDPETPGDAADAVLADVPAGRTGALRTADGLRERADGLDVRVVTPPAPADLTNDLDEWVTQWDGDLGVLLRSARPPESVPGYDAVTDTADPADAFDDFDASEYDAGSTGADETTDDIRDLFAAIDRLDAQRVAEKTIVKEWVDSSSATERAFVPTWAPSGYSGTANFVNRDRWVDSGDRGGYGGPVCMAAINAGLVSDQRCPDAVEGETWFTAVDHLRSLGFDIPEYVESPENAAEDESTPPATECNVVVDKQRAWSADRKVVPEDLDGDGLDLQASNGDEGWVCDHCGEQIVGGVRASAVAAGDIDCCERQLNTPTYNRHYRRLRDQFGAPLPEFVTRETRTEQWALVQGALRALQFDHLDADAIRSEIVAAGRGDERFRLNPSWRESESGASDDDRASVIWYSGGPVFEAALAADSDRSPDDSPSPSLRPLTFVGLDAGIVSWDEFCEADSQFGALSGDVFRDVYEAARNQYGAPLPDYYGTSPEHLSVLPDAEALQNLLLERRDDPDVDPGRRLDAARDATENLYREAATTADEPTILRALPSLGKSRAAVKTAEDIPALYTATRRALRKEALDRAEEFDVRAMHLPVFGGEATPGEEFREAAEAVLRENGQRLLRQGNAVQALVANRVGHDLALPDPDSDDDVVDLDHAVCSSAAGDHGLDWWVRVHAARAWGYRPQQIHQQAETLFGAELPCQCGDDDCDYSEAWDRVSDPDRPLDLLVGHPVHAHVPSARTYFERVGKRTSVEPRAVVFDEYPGDVFDREFGDEWRDHAAWLAGCLNEEIDDRDAMARRARDLWKDDAVRSWLRGGEVLTDGRDGAADSREEPSNGDKGDDSGERLPAPFGRVRDALEALLDCVDARKQLNAFSDLLGAAGDRLRGEGVLGRAPATVLDDVAAARTRVDELEADSSTPEWIVDVLNDALDDISRVAGEFADRAVATPGSDSSCRDLAVEQLHESERLAGDLRHLVRRSIRQLSDVGDDGDLDEGLDDARDALRAAHTAVGGGRQGIEALAIHSDSGDAHPLAGPLLFAAIAPGESAMPGVSTTVECESFGWGEDRETTRVKSVRMAQTRILADRDEQGAIVRRPPATGDSPVVGLDATGNDTLWALVLGRDGLSVADPHGSMAERRDFLHDVYGLQVIQTTEQARPYGGSPTETSFDADLEHVRAAAALDGHDDPAVITTKKVEEFLAEEFLNAGAASIDHYSDLRGENNLSDRDLGVILGYQHHGDQAIEKIAAFAGESVTREGYGMDLDYNSEAANAALRHMREDSVLQAALRVGREPEVDPVVIAHTAALREDLPVVGQGVSVETWSETTQQVADVGLRFDRRFTSSDVHERLQNQLGEEAPTRRSVQRALATLTDAGYLDADDPGIGRAKRYRAREEPGTGEVGLDDAIPDESGSEVSYTSPVGVFAPTTTDDAPASPPSGEITNSPATLPSPETVGPPAPGG